MSPKGELATYEGERKSGLKHGWGRLVWDNGEYFEGCFEHGRRVKGLFVWENRDRYVGEWKDDLMHGSGTYTYADGRTYRGGWNSGYRHGVGLYEWTSGEKYEGSFDMDKCVGVGIHTYSDGKQFQGRWAQNRKQGPARLSWVSGEVTKGEWERNLLVGATVYVDVDGTRYEELWKDGARIGARKRLRRSQADMEALMERVRDEGAPVKGGEGTSRWAPDGDHPVCFKCGDEFSLLVRRHHCRCCGLVFCEKCSSRKVLLEDILPTRRKPSRVCDECAVERTDVQLLEELEAVRRALADQLVECEAVEEEVSSRVVSLHHSGGGSVTSHRSSREPRKKGDKR